MEETKWQLESQYETSTSTHVDLYPESLIKIEFKYRHAIREC